MHHYWYYWVWVWKTRAEYIVDTLTWFPTWHVMPVASSADCAITAASNLINALDHPSPVSPLYPLNNNACQTLHQLATIFADGATNLQAPPGFPL